MVQRQRIADGESEDHSGEMILWTQGGEQIPWILLIADCFLPAVL